MVRVSYWLDVRYCLSLLNLNQTHQTPFLA